MAMKCPKCGKEDSVVLDSRGVEDAIRRRRECEWCGCRFTTYESYKWATKKSLWKEISPKLAANIKEAIIKSFQE